MVEDSIKNCRRMSLWRAPSDLRRPISRVRSVTETSMMFMMTMPPTTSEMEAMRMVTPKKAPLSLPQIERNDWLVSITKSSGAL